MAGALARTPASITRGLKHTPDPPQSSDSHARTPASIMRGLKPTCSSPSTNSTPSGPNTCLDYERIETSFGLSRPFGCIGHRPNTCLDYERIETQIGRVTIEYTPAVARTPASITRGLKHCRGRLNARRDRCPNTCLDYERIETHRQKARSNDSDEPEHLPRLRED